MPLRFTGQIKEVPGPAGPPGPPGPAGDPGPAGPSGSATIASAIVDFGALPKESGYFAITDAGVSTTSKILMTTREDPATKDDDENEMNLLHTAVSAIYNGGFDVTITGRDGYLHGKYTIYYAVG